MGDLESHDLVCRHLCKQTNAIVIAVDYRLAPEYKFPSQITETKDAITEIIKNQMNLKLMKIKSFCAEIVRWCPSNCWHNYVER